ncbi:MAG TPA: molybdopterin-dependent oxidoreductase, partial [Thermoanaerobaculaceae bacterium]|nr:molybdopterin-dependent oxidoreductase [Thermoanaerobaculaceae bacterium]
VGANAYGFVQRGFSTVVKPAMGGSLLDTECVTCGLCIGTCPTGAISAKLPLAKPGPWATDSTVTTCHYCSVGCQLAYQSYGDTLIKVGRIEDSPHTLGCHCKKGLFGSEFTQAEDRMTRAWIRPGRELQETSVDDAIGYTAMRLKELSRRFKPEEMAVFVSPRSTNEEIYLAQKLARIGLGTQNITSFASLVNDEYLCPEIVSTASYSDLTDAQAVLVVNSNLDEEHFVVDLLAKRALRNGGKLVFVGPESNRTSRFADVHLACHPGTQSIVVLALVAELASRGKVDIEDLPELASRLKDVNLRAIEESTGIRPEVLREAADILAGAISRVVVFNKDFRGKRLPGDDRLFAAAAKALMAPWLALWEKANMQGLLDMGANPKWFPGYQPVHDGAVEALEKEWCVVLQDLKGQEGDLARALASRRIRVAIVLGEDPLGNPGLPAQVRNGLLAVDFLVVGDVVMTATARAANVVLPLSAHAETSGTMTNAEHRVQQVRQAIPPGNGLETWQIISQLAARMGLRFKMKYASPREVFAEIQRVVPLYSNLRLDGQAHEAVWDAEAMPLPQRALPPLRLETAEEPIPTLTFDHLEGRFARRLETLFKEARAQFGM